MRQWVFLLFSSLTLTVSTTGQSYEAMDSTWLRGKLTKKGEILTICIFIASLAFVYLYDVRPEWFSFLPRLTAGRTILPGVPTFQGPYKVIALCISCPILALNAFEFDGLLKSVFSWNPLRYLGNMSYSYYLIHGLSLHGVALIANSIVPESKPSIVVFLLALPLGFAVTWIASTFLFILIEKPISMRRRPAPVFEAESLEAPPYLAAYRREVAASVGWIVPFLRRSAMNPGMGTGNDSESPSAATESPGSGRSACGNLVSKIVRPK